MIAIRPVSDLRNKFTDIESTVNTGQPVFLTKNGYGSMVVMSIDAYSRMNRNVEHIRFFSFTLKCTAVNHIAVSVNFQNML